MADDTGRSSVKVKIGNLEFEASGTDAAVNDRFSQFMKLAEKLPRESVQAASPTTVPIVESGARPVAVADRAAATSTDDMLGRAFRVENGRVSLNALPQGETAARDAVLLLLYGRYHLVDKAPTIIADLLEGLRVSGVPIPRTVADVVSGSESLVTRAGIKRASRYSLTNRGMQTAEEILRRLLM